MIWRLRRHEPSFSSMNEKSFESRRVRTQPWTCTPEIGALLASAALTEIGPDMPEVGRSLPIWQSRLACALHYGRTPPDSLGHRHGAREYRGGGAARPHSGDDRVVRRRRRSDRR